MDLSLYPGIVDWFLRSLDAALFRALAGSPPGPTHAGAGHAGTGAGPAPAGDAANGRAAVPAPAGRPGPSLLSRPPAAVPAPAEPVPAAGEPGPAAPRGAVPGGTPLPAVRPEGGGDDGRYAGPPRSGVVVGPPAPATERSPGSPPRRGPVCRVGRPAGRAGPAPAAPPRRMVRRLPVRVEGPPVRGGGPAAGHGPLRSELAVPQFVASPFVLRREEAAGGGKGRRRRPGGGYRLVLVLDVPVAGRVRVVLDWKPGGGPVRAQVASVDRLFLATLARVLGEMKEEVSGAGLEVRLGLLRRPGSEVSCDLYA